MIDWAALSLDGAVEQLGLVACEISFKMRYSRINTYMVNYVN